MWGGVFRQGFILLVYRLLLREPNSFVFVFRLHSSLLLAFSSVKAGIETECIVVWVCRSEAGASPVEEGSRPRSQGLWICCAPLCSSCGSRDTEKHSDRPPHLAQPGQHRRSFLLKGMPNTVPPVSSCTTINS